MSSISFIVLGVAAPQGSMRALFSKKQQRAFVIPANKLTMPWRQDVAARATEARQARGILAGLWPTSEAVELRATFFLPRPVSHVGKKGLKAKAPVYPAKRPDLSKLVRAAEDALSGVIYDDDARIVSHRVQKLYAPPGEAPRAEFEVAILAAGPVKP